MKIKNFWTTLPKPFTVLAPMEDVTDYIFREVVATFLPKPDVLFTEFTNVEALNSEGFDKTIHRFKFSKKQRPIVAQIWGIKPDNFFKTAKLVNELGFDGIDINMGCPYRTVIKIGAGSALIENQKLAQEIISATKEGSNKLPISVKTRIGVKEVKTDEWITFLLEQKIDALTVHGRTAKQMSKVPADWQEVKKAVDIAKEISPDTVIIGNGDVKNYDQVSERHLETGVKGIMIGRGIFSNPWVFEKETKKHSRDEHLELLRNHLLLSLKEDISPKQYDKIKKFFKMYVNNFNKSSELRDKLMSTKNNLEALEILDNFKFDKI